jgi:hypothetical protein
VLNPVEHARPARRLAVLGAAGELLAAALMKRRLGELGEPYHSGACAAYGQAARALTVSGGLLLAAPAKRSRAAAVAGGAMLLAGAVCERWSVFEAGFPSARDPRYTVEPQRMRIMQGRGRGASRRGAAARREP